MKKVTALLLALVLAMCLTGCKGSDYKNAVSLYESGQYEEAVDKFTELGDYKDSQLLLQTCKYESAKAMINSGSYEEAKAIFEELGDFEDSADYINSCDYNIALELYNSGDYEGAIEIFETISDYSDSADKIESANNELNRQKYSNVYDALEDNTWYFNGGSDTTLNSVTFDEDTATIAQVEMVMVNLETSTYERVDNGSNSYSYTVNGDSISIVMDNGSDLVINYSMSNNDIELGGNDYYTIEEVDAAIQGYWKCCVQQSSFYREVNFYINGNHITEAQAFEDDQLPYDYVVSSQECTYTLFFGGFEANLKWGFGDKLFWNIIDETPTVFWGTNIGIRSNNCLPGEAGYELENGH